MINFFVHRFLYGLILPSALLVSWATARFAPHYLEGPSNLHPGSYTSFTEPSTEPAPWESTAQHHVFAPMVVNMQPKIIELQDAWISNSQGVENTNYMVDDEIQYWISGISTYSVAQDVNLKWLLSGPCGTTQVYSGTVTLEPGGWQHVHPSAAPDCSGEHTATAELYSDTVPVQTLSTRFSVERATSVVVSDQQGFDRCYLSDVAEMAEWWENSPYQVYNLYLGGVSFYCKDNPLDAAWVEQVAGQGWRFIQTWVGPQAPCTDKYSNRFSYDPETAYSQGRQEARSAAEASQQLGFTGENIIYYDLEGYHDDVSSCHNAVDAFLDGWTEQLHELGMKSGAYGAGCSSFVAKWADISPPPDDVWIAHWYRSEYDPNASVWDASCVPNDLWEDHRRIKQYAGDHVETWGAVSLGIDSNVLDGEIVALETGGQEEGSAGHLLLEISGRSIQNLGLLSEDQAWVLSGGELLLTHDGGATWVDSTPADSHVLDVDYDGQLNAWLVRRMKSTGELSVMRTQDGGKTWEAGEALVEAGQAYQYNTAFIDTLDTQMAWVVLKVPSGSSFSLGRLWVTEDGGATWQERAVPLGEPVSLLDARNGWMAGGPAGDQLYRTEDGGRTWEQYALDLPTDSYAVIGLPDFSNQLNGWVAVKRMNAADDEDDLILYQSSDGGETWERALGFAVDSRLLSSRLLLEALAVIAGHDLAGVEKLFARGTLPQGVAALDFYDQVRGLAVTQAGGCEGDKHNAGSALLRCEQSWQLVRTVDGGITWQAIEIPIP